MSTLLAYYSLADSADHAEECSKLHYHAEKDSLFVSVVFIVVLWFVCDNQRDLRETLGISSSVRID